MSTSTITRVPYAGRRNCCLVLSTRGDVRCRERATVEMTVTARFGDGSPVPYADGTTVPKPGLYCLADADLVESWYSC
jgi:hypothetical protein